MASVLGQATEAAAVGDDEGIRELAERWPAVAFEWWRKARRMEAGAFSVKAMRRRKSYSLGLSLDNVLACASPFGGLVAFQWLEKAREETPPWEWSLLHLASDRGPDNVCLMMYMMHVLGLNFHQCWDDCHDAWAETKHALLAAGCWSFELLLTIVYNYRCGPENSSERFNSMTQTLREYIVMIKSRGRTDPLLDWFLEKILFDRDQSALIGTEGVEERVLDWIAASQISACNGSKVNSCRWYGLIKSGEDFDPDWNIFLMGLVISQIMKGIAPTTAFSEANQQKAKVRLMQGTEGVTSMREASNAVRQMHGAVHGSTAICLALLSEPTNQLRSRLARAVIRPSEISHGRHSAATRSVLETKAWLIEHVRRECLQACIDMFAVLRDVGTQQRSRFIVAPTPAELRMEATSPRVIDEVALAKVGGTIAQHGSFSKLSRQSYRLWSWPQRACLMLSSDVQESETCLHDFLQDAQIHDHTKSRTDVFWRLAAARSPFAAVATIQLRKALDEHGNRLTEEFCAWL